MKKLLAVCCILSFALMLSSCTESIPSQSEQIEEIVYSAPEIDDPEKALEEIYSSIDTMGISDGTAADLTDKFYIDINLLEDYYFKFSSGRFGVADVFLLKPTEEDSPMVRELLEQVKLARIKEFENYDIHNSYQIAQDAQIFEQGEYLIMLMLPDNEPARVIIDRYIRK